MVRQTLFRGDYYSGFFLTGERDWAQLWIQQGQVGIYSQEAGWEGVSMDGNWLLRENIKAKAILARLTQREEFSPKAGQGEVSDKSGELGI